MTSEISDQAVVREAIEELYGPCPVEDFERSNAWAEGIDWERVQSAVETKHPEFSWVEPKARSSQPAEAMIFEILREMLEEAGRRSLE